MLKRIFLYLKEMYPPSQLLASLILSFCFLLCLSKIHGVPFPLAPNVFCGVVSFVWFALLLRIMDEFKDYEDDLRNYPNRPLPSGRVKKSDLKTFSAVVVALIIVSNVFWKLQGLFAAVTFAYCLLMLKWFFMEKVIRKSLPLAFVTHHPVAYLVMVYLAATFAEATGLPILASPTLMLVPLVLGITNWEISRKIRGPKEETAYVTYSMIFGPRVAASLALLCQVVTLAGMLLYFRATGVPGWFVALFLGLFFALWLPYFRFMKELTQGLRLKKWAEYIVILTQFSVILAYFIF